MNTQHKKQGFTIIEVVLVLAIAGLIFLMVFIALPALQRNQRDTQRKDDLGRVKVAINNYMSSNRGNIPTSADALTSFKAKYLAQEGEYADPQGGDYVFRYDQSGKVPDIGQIVYANGRVCGNDGEVAPGKARDYALLVKLEGQEVPFCLDSN